MQDALELESGGFDDRTEARKDELRSAGKRYIVPGSPYDEELWSLCKFMVSLPLPYVILH